MKELKRLLDQKEQEILNEKYPLEDKVNKLAYTHQRIKSRNYLNMNKISNSEFFAILLESLNPDYSNDLIMLEGINNIRRDNLDELSIIFMQMEKGVEICDKSIFGNISKEKKQNKVIKNIYDYQNIFTNEIEFKIFITIFYDLYRDNIADNDLITGILYFIAFKYRVLNNEDDVKELQEESREVRRILYNKKILNKVHIDDDLEYYLKIICEHLENLELEQENFNRNKKRKLTQLKKIIYSWEQLLRTTYITIKDDLANLINLDEDIKNEVLRIVFEHNEKSYTELKKENNINNNNSISQLEKLLFDYQINPDLIPSDKRILLLQNKSIDELKELLEILKNPLYSFLNISNPYYIDILLYSNRDILNKIIEYHKKAVIRNEFLQQNVGILIPSNSKENENKYLFYIFNENVKMLDSYRIKWNDLSVDEINITLMEPNKLKDILSCLEKYFIPFNQPSCYYFLNHPELISYIDSYIELDLYNLLLDAPEDLTIDSVLKRITLLKSIDGKIVNESGYIPNNILTGKNFYVSNEQLDNYIINHTDYFIDKNAKMDLESNEHFKISENIFEITEIINLEEKFKQNELIYNFDGIIISRPKVLRCFQFLSNGNYNINNNLFSSIIYNSNLSYEQINQIKEMLFSRKLN